MVSHEFTTNLSDFDLFFNEMAIFSKVWKPDFESHNSLKLSFTNIWGLCSNFSGCESFLEENSLDILAVCETDLNHSIYYGNCYVRDYLPLIWLAGSCSLCEGKTSFCMWLISRKLCRFLFMFWLALLHSVSYVFFLSESPSLSKVFDAIYSNIDDVLSIIPSANVFVIEALMSIIWTGWPIKKPCQKPF